MKKYAIYSLLVVGIVLVFVPMGVPFSEVYLQALGICLCMFSLYTVSSKLTSKESHKDQNLKF